MQTITLEVSPEIAEAYQFASLEERQQIQQIVSLLLKKEKENENDIDFLRKIMDCLFLEQEEELPLSQAQQQELERRLENYEKNSTTGSSWEDVKKRLGFSQ